MISVLIRCLWSILCNHKSIVSSEVYFNKYRDYFESWKFGWHNEKGICKSLRII